MDTQNGLPSEVSTTLAGILGAAVSMQFIRGLNPLQKLLMVITGAVFSVLFTDPISKTVGAPVSWEYGVAFLVGLFGWSVVGSIITALQKADWWGLLMEVVRRLLGRGG